MKKEARKNNMKNLSKKIIKKAKGITLISLVITIIILLILAGVTLSLTLGDNGIITQAEKAKEAHEIAAIKEDIQLVILDKEVEKGGEGLTQEELEEILKDYGEIQEDGNTIKTDDGYEIDIDEIYKPGGGTGGGDAATDEEIAALLEKIKELEQTVTDLTNTKTELEGTIEDLNRQLEEEQGNSAELQEQIENLQGEVDTLNKTIEEQQSTIDSLNTQIAELQKKQSTGNAVAADVLKGRTFSNGTQVGLTGTMENRGALNWSGSNTTYNVPAGYYSGGTLDSRPSYNAGVTAADNRANPNSTNYKTGYNAGVTAADNRANPNSTNYKTGYNAGYSAGVNAGKIDAAITERHQADTSVSSTTYTFTLPANTGKTYMIFTYVHRGNTTANSLHHTLASNNGSVTDLYSRSTTSSNTSITHHTEHIWKLVKSNTGSAATVTVTIGRANANIVVRAYSVGG